MVDMCNHFYDFIIIHIKYEIYTTSVEIISSIYTEIVQEGVVSLASCTQCDYL